MQIPDNMVPLIYLITVAVIAGGLQAAGVPELTVGLIIGAGITRVKASPSPVSTTPSTEEK